MNEEFNLTLNVMSRTVDVREIGIEKEASTESTEDNLKTMIQLVNSKRVCRGNSDFEDVCRSKFVHC